MSGEREDRLNSFDLPRSEREDESYDAEQEQGTAEALEDEVQDQVILAPEIMMKILGHLDMKSLRQVRLVCKSWLLEAQVHMTRRGIVRFRTSGRCRFGVVRAEYEGWSMKSFLGTHRKKLPGLPNPFKALDVIVSPHWEDAHFTELCSLPPPLIVTRLDTGTLSLDHAIPLITRFSSSLEHLQLAGSSWVGSHPLDPEQKFPKLRHFYVQVESDFEYGARRYFPSVVAWLANSSPNLETYEFNEAAWGAPDFITQVLMEADVRNVKAFKFGCNSSFNNAALRHLISIPYRHLESLQLAFPTESWTGYEDALMGIVGRSYMTLKELDLAFIVLGVEAQARFPVCPNVQQLRLTFFPNLQNFVPAHFPSLQTLTLECDECVELCSWSDISASPILGLRRLRIANCVTRSPQPDQRVRQLFEKFPSLESLYIEDSNLSFVCSLMAEGLPNSSNLLQGVKNLIVNVYSEWSVKDYVGWYSLLSLLTGLESVQVNTNKTEILTTLPVKELLNLKVLQFPWDGSLDTRKLLDATRGLEKVLISNCCSVRRREDESPSKALLVTFFEQARNAECGCKNTIRKLGWFPENKFYSVPV